MTTQSSSPLKPLSPQDWESVIEEFQHGLQKWSPPHLFLDQALFSLSKKDFPSKLSILNLLEEFSHSFFTNESDLTRLLDLLYTVVQAPLDPPHITYFLKEQFMTSATAILLSFDSLGPTCLQYLVDLLLNVINRPNHAADRHTRALACECLRCLEKSYPCLLSEIAPHLWTLCQSERTHASQSYILLFTMVIFNIVDRKINVSILNTSVPLVPFNVPVSLLSSESGGGALGLNYKELRRAMSFLLDSPQVLTPCGMVEFLHLIMPVSEALELQASMLKVQFFGMIYSFDLLLCHVVVVMYSRFFYAFDGQEGEIVRRLMLISMETQHLLVFRLLSIHWLLALISRLMSVKEVGRYKSVIEMGLRLHPAVFDPLALKALKLDVLAVCSIYLDTHKTESSLDDGGVADKFAVKLLEEGLVSVSAFKWLPPWSTETVVAFRAFHKFLIGESSHVDSYHSSTQALMDSAIFQKLQGLLVDLTKEFQRLVPVVVYFTDRFLSCERHCWLGERLLQTFDEFLLSKVKVDYKLVAYFPIFDRIAENSKVPPSQMIGLLLKFLMFLVEKHGPDTGIKSWSHGSKVLGICRTMLIYHQSSRLFIGLSRLLTFSCLYFPDLEVRDNSRIYLRMLICIPGVKLRAILNLSEQFLGISPNAQPSSFFNLQSPRHYQNFRKSRSISSYIHLERVIPLLVKQCWSLSLSSLGVGAGRYLESTQDSEPQVELGDKDDSADFHISLETGMSKSKEPLRVMDSKISEILSRLRRHFSCIPDFRHMPGIKVGISCSLRFESGPFSHEWGGDSPSSKLDGIDALPAIYATVLRFSSSPPYGSIPSYHIPFLLGEPQKNHVISGFTGSLDIVPVGNDSGEEESFRALVTIDLEPQEPTPGSLDVLIESNTENGQIIRGQLQNVIVGIEDMFLKAPLPIEIPEDAVPTYYAELYDALWGACGSSSNIGREIFPLKGGKGAAAISGTQSVKLLEVPVSTLIQATQQYLAPFVVKVSGERLVSLLRDGGMIRNAVWSDALPASFLDHDALISDIGRGPLPLTYIDDEDEKDDTESQLNVSRRNIGCMHVLIFLPPRFHLLFQMEVGDLSTLVRIRTDHWPCLAYVDDYLEALFFGIGMNMSAV